MRFSHLAVICALTSVAACATPRADAPTRTVDVTHASSASPVTTEPSATSTPATAATPSPVPTETPVVSPAPATAAPTEAPTAVPTASPTVAPTATPSSTPQPPVLAPNAAPEIVGLHINKTTLKAGETVSGTIETSSNVASVEARIATYSIDVPKISAGHFALSYTVPNVPFFLRKSYDMIVIARNAEGAETTRTVAITIR